MNLNEERLHFQNLAVAHKVIGVAVAKTPVAKARFLLCSG
jgi:hypothetical protein